MYSKFSIITITFNSEKTIERTLKSVLNQTYKDYEYIIVDGASKDGTMDIVRKYEPLFEGRMTWKSEPDKGIYNAMNKGIMRSTGEIIGIVNSDDWLEPNTLQILADEIARDNSNLQKILTGEVLFHYDDGETQLYPTSRETYEHYSKIYRMGLNHPATFVPRCVYDNIGIFDEKYKLYADADFIIRCYKADVPVHFIHQVLSNMADGGASNTMNKNKIINDLRYLYSKHSKNRADYNWLMFMAHITVIIKAIVPKFILKNYRRRNN